MRTARRGDILLAALCTLAVLVCLFTGMSGVLAADVATTVVTVPWGDWVAWLLLLATPFILAVTLLVSAWLVKRLPGPIQAIYYTWKVDQLLKNAVQFGINETRGAVAGRALGIDTGSTAVAEALNYSVRHGSPGDIKFAGGADGVAEKVVARMTLDVNTTAQDVLAEARAKPAFREAATKAGGFHTHKMTPIFPRGAK